MIVKKNKKTVYSNELLIKTDKGSVDWYYNGHNKIYGSKYKSVSLNTDKRNYILNKDKNLIGTTLEDV